VFSVSCYFLRVGIMLCLSGGSAIPGAVVGILTGGYCLRQFQLTRRGDTHCTSYLSICALSFVSFSVLLLSQQQPSFVFVLHFYQVVAVHYWGPANWWFAFELNFKSNWQLMWEFEFNLASDWLAP